MHDLSGKVVIITGASRGIGAATAVAMAKAGASVVLAARTVDQIEVNAERIREDGGNAIAVACDVSNFQAMENTVAKCIDTYGRLDLFVANAGVIDPIGPLVASNPASWTHAVQINLIGAYNGLRAVLPIMQAQKSGTVINISSGAALSPMEGWSHYCAAKAATAMLLNNARLEHADDGIRFIGFRPGTVATYMQSAIKASGINPVSQMDPSDHYKPEWPAQAIVWMCTPDADEFLGQELHMGDEEIQRRSGLI
ncbi:MAG: SDR family oxidoreductase [Rhodobacteraceae bacterium]|nr:SDR family oxidoreductase [Paracoccaceae bacterium]